MTLIVNAKRKTLTLNNRHYRCRIGRDGYIALEKGTEGDFKTPLGRYQFRYGLYRADRLPAPSSGLTFHALTPDDGWCDDVNHSAYNLPVKLPLEASAEALWKESGVYDIIIVLGHNDDPPVAGLGSAIFLHVSHTDDKPTAGCVAVSPDVMAKILPHLDPSGFIEITA